MHVYPWTVRKYKKDLSPKAKETKAKINKWDLIKPKSFCIAKEPIHKRKRQMTEWKKISVNEMTDKELISKIYKRAHTAQFQNQINRF